MSHVARHYNVTVSGCFDSSALKQHQEMDPESPLAELSIYVARDGVG